jgi:hypothetical protein
VDFRTALKVALAADTVSIAVMELLDNAVMLAVPGAMDAGLSNWVFWASLAFALTVAFLLTTPSTDGSSHAAMATPWSTSTTTHTDQLGKVACISTAGTP